MTIYRKINIALSILSLLLFVIPIFIFEGNVTMSKFAIVVYYLLAYVWFVAPAIISFLVYGIGKYKNKTFDVLMIILNSIALFWLIPMFKLYISNY